MEVVVVVVRRIVYPIYIYIYIPVGKYMYLLAYRHNATMMLQFKLYCINIYDYAILFN